MSSARKYAEIAAAALAKLLQDSTDSRKGFAEPVRCYKVLGLYEDLDAEGSVIREESDGFKVLLDLQKRDRAEAIAVLEAIVNKLKG